MESSKKQIIYYIVIFLISFSLGLFFDNKILCKTTQLELQPEKKLEIVLQEDIQEEKDKTTIKEEGCSIYVDAGGSLKNPGVYCLDTGSLVIDAVNKAGGFSKDSANSFIARKINLAQPLVNNQKLYFPFQNELICELKQVTVGTEITFNTPITTLPTVEPYIDQTTTTTSTSGTTNTSDNSSTQCVNINTATKEQLITLNGVGESTAGKIIEGRPYANINDLLNVSGIGEATLSKFKDKICI